MNTFRLTVNGWIARIFWVGDKYFIDYITDQNGNAAPSFVELEIRNYLKDF